MFFFLKYIICFKGFVGKNIIIDESFSVPGSMKVLELKCVKYARNTVTVNQNGGFAFFFE